MIPGDQHSQATLPVSGLRTRSATVVQRREVHVSEAAAAGAVRGVECTECAGGGSSCAPRASANSDRNTRILNASAAPGAHYCTLGQYEHYPPPQ